MTTLLIFIYRITFGFVWRKINTASRMLIFESIYRLLNIFLIYYVRND